MRGPKKLPDFRSGNEGKILKVGLIGCGQIAAHHLRFIARTEGARVVALSDPVLGNARRFAEQYGVRDVYSSHLEMLNSSPLDVVHILTPPEFHYSQAVDAIDHGVHVLLEKPCTIDSQELEDLYQRAEGKGVLLCPDFIELFNPSFLQSAALIESGQLGNVVHIEIHLSVDLNIYSSELRESMGVPWRYKLPGGILHDIITHPLYMALRWLGEPERLTVFPQSHRVLPQGLTDHLSVMLEGKACTANITISAVIKPEPYHIQIFCERGNVLVNFETSATLVTRTNMLPRFLRRATANFNQAYQLFSSGISNLIRFARGRLLPYQGLENLIPRFYDCIRAGGELPISKELAVAVARTEEAIFTQAGKLHVDARDKPSTQRSVTRLEKILVTGATGYLGSAVVRKLVKEGYHVRALVRELSHTELLEKLGVELVYGDIRNADRLVSAAHGMDVVIHMAAALHGTSEFMLDCAAKGTKNVAVAAKSCALKRVIYISSMSVYDYLNLRDGDVISEESPLEGFPQLRGAYSLAKRRAEDEALSHLQDMRPQWTILRPSIIVGEDNDPFRPLGKKVGKLLLCPGSGKKLLPLIHIADTATAIVKLLETDGTSGRIFNLSAEGITQQEYIEFIRKTGYENLQVVYIPYWLATAVTGVLSALRVFNSKIPNITNRRLASLYRSVEATSAAIEAETRWQPRRNLLETLVIEAQNSKVIMPDPSVDTISNLATLHK